VTVTKNELNLVGKTIGVDVQQTKGGKTMVKVLVGVDPPAWMKRDPQPDVIEVTCFGRTADEARLLAPGQMVSIAGRLSGREHNGRWYVSAVAENIRVAPQAWGEAEHAPVRAKHSSVKAPAPAQPPYAGDPDDLLPF